MDCSANLNVTEVSHSFANLPGKWKDIPWSGRSGSTFHFHWTVRPCCGTEVEGAGNLPIWFQMPAFP